MGKFLRNLTDGSLRCRYCGDNECNCLEDGKTTLEFRYIWSETEWAILVQFKKQKLTNGKMIPSGYSIWIPNKTIIKKDKLLKKITIDNNQINKLGFD